MDAETFAKWLRVDKTFEQTPGMPSARPSAKRSDQGRTPKDITTLHQFARRYFFGQKVSPAQEGSTAQKGSQALCLFERLCQKKHYKEFNKLRALSSYMWTCQAPDVLLVRICGELIRDPENVDKIFVHARNFVTGKSSDTGKTNDFDPGTWMDMVNKIGLKVYSGPKMEEYLTQFKSLQQVC
jgi:hypothetical protein